jgi:DNA polymerase-3 subunit beta
MKILCDRQKLQEAIAVVGGLAPLKTPKPILQNILFRADADGVTIHATDLEVSARVELDAVKVDRPGAILLPARETAALFRELDEPTVSLLAKDGRCTIASGTGSFVLLSDDPDLFPADIEIQGETEITLAAGVFLDLIRRTTFAAAREETRYAINGLLLEVSEGQLRAVATDGRRLALAYHPLDTDVLALRTVVPLRVLQTLLRAVSHANSQLSIRFASTRIGFFFDGLVLVSQLLDNRFPDYEQVIPKVAETSIELDKAVLEQNLRRVSVLASGDSRMVRFDIASASLGLSAERTGIGRGEMTMEADVSGPGGTVSFNPEYILDALKVCDIDRLRIDMTDDSTPARFFLGETFTYVLMPISGS